MQGVYLVGLLSTGMGELSKQRRGFLGGIIRSGRGIFHGKSAGPLPCTCNLSSVYLRPKYIFPQIPNLYLKVIVN
jgi:hypothetical protein